MSVIKYSFYFPHLLPRRVSKHVPTHITSHLLWLRVFFHRFQALDLPPPVHTLSASFCFRRPASLGVCRHCLHLRGVPIIVFDRRALISPQQTINTTAKRHFNANRILWRRSAATISLHTFALIRESLHFCWVCPCVCIHAHANN